MAKWKLTFVFILAFSLFLGTGEVPGQDQEKTKVRKKRKKPVKWHKMGWRGDVTKVLKKWAKENAPKFEIKPMKEEPQWAKNLGKPIFSFVEERR